MSDFMAIQTTKSDAEDLKRNSQCKINNLIINGVTKDIIEKDLQADGPSYFTGK